MGLDALRLRARLPRLRRRGPRVGRRAPGSCSRARVAPGRRRRARARSGPAPRAGSRRRAARAGTARAGRGACAASSSVVVGALADVAAGVLGDFDARRARRGAQPAPGARGRRAWCGRRRARAAAALAVRPAVVGPPAAEPTARPALEPEARLASGRRDPGAGRAARARARRARASRAGATPAKVTGSSAARTRTPRGGSRSRAWATSPLAFRPTCSNDPKPVTSTRGSTPRKIPARARSPAPGRRRRLSAASARGAPAMPAERRSSIANGQGFWGDSILGPVRLVREGPLDYLTLDYLAEVTMSILQKQRSRDPTHGLRDRLRAHARPHPARARRRRASRSSPTPAA